MHEAVRQCACVRKNVCCFDDERMIVCSSFMFIFFISLLLTTVYKGLFDETRLCYMDTIMTFLTNKIGHCLNYVSITQPMGFYFREKRKHNFQTQNKTLFILIFLVGFNKFPTHSRVPSNHPSKRCCDFCHEPIFDANPCKTVTLTVVLSVCNITCKFVISVKSATRNVHYLVINDNCTSYQDILSYSTYVVYLCLQSIYEYSVLNERLRIALSIIVIDCLYAEHFSIEQVDFELIDQVSNTLLHLEIALYTSNYCCNSEFMAINVKIDFLSCIYHVTMLTLYFLESQVLVDKMIVLSNNMFCYFWSPSCSLSPVVYVKKIT